MKKKTMNWPTCLPGRGVFPVAELGPDDLFKFRQLLLEVSQSVFLRWKVLHQLRTMALTDELTGLYNRRGFLLLGSP